MKRLKDVPKGIPWIKDRLFLILLAIAPLHGSADREGDLRMYAMSLFNRSNLQKGDQKESAASGELPLGREPFGSKRPDLCKSKYRNITLTARHLEGEGIGFHQGYTTLEAFFSPTRCFSSWIPYLDLEGHIFNDSNLAVNLGIGTRYDPGNSYIYGGSVYYDWRETNHFRYNQIGLGLEFLSSSWGLYLNGYIPLGETISGYYDQNTDFETFSGFYAFQNNQILLIEGDRSTLSRKKQFSLQGIDAQVLFSLIDKNLFSFELGCGPYFYFGHFDQYAFGGEIEMNIRITEYFSLRGQVSYDNLFHGRGQGEFAIHFPLGKTNGEREKCPSRFCTLSPFLDARLSSGQNRREIIPVSRKNETSVLLDTVNTFPAIDPATGEPFHVLLVNNKKREPVAYPSLQQALDASEPRDIIYIYPGDETTEGLNAFGSPFIALDNQKIWGSSTVHTLQTAAGPVSIPPQTNVLPKLTANANSIIFIAADGNEFSGLHFISSGNSNGTALASPASPNGITGITISNNVFDSLGSSQAIGKTDNNRFEGDVEIFNNLFTAQNGFLIDISPQIDSAVYSIYENEFHVNSGLAFQSEGVDGFTGDLSIVFDSNSIVGFDSSVSVLPASVRLMNLNDGTALIQNNTFSGNGIATDEAFILAVEANLSFTEMRHLDVQILGNQFFSSSSKSISVLSQFPVNSICLQILNNISQSTASNVYTIDKQGGALLQYETTTPGSIPTNIPSTFTGTATPIAPGGCSFFLPPH